MVSLSLRSAGKIRPKIPHIACFTGVGANLRNAFLFLLPTVVAINLATTTASLANPLFTGADPDTLVDGQSYWIYPTTEGVGKSDFYTYRSKDLKLKRWQRIGPILKKQDILWIDKDGAREHELWAPGIFKNGNNYYLFFAVGPQNPTPSRIGVAVAETPSGEFVDSGKPLVTGSSEFEAIDPMVFKDTSKNDLEEKIFLYCGGSAGPQMHVYELNKDCVSIKQKIEVPTPINFTEAPFMHKRGDIYYLSYSHGRWNDESYSVCYSTSRSPTGPWTYGGEILKSNKRHAGPGHHSFAKSISRNQWYIIYHRWNNAKKAGKMPAVRSVAIAPVKYDKGGLIMPIKMKD